VEAFRDEGTLRRRAGLSKREPDHQPRKETKDHDSYGLTLGARALRALALKGPAPMTAHYISGTD